VVPWHSGVGTGDPVFNPEVLWKFNAGGSVYSSPAVEVGAGEGDDVIEPLKA
jgi:hypothetical protein